MNHVIDLVKTDEGGGTRENCRSRRQSLSWGCRKSLSPLTRWTCWLWPTQWTRAGRPRSRTRCRSTRRIAIVWLPSSQPAYRGPGSLPLEAERDAGKAFYRVVKPYIGIARLPVAQETAKIRGLLMDLRKEENAPYVATLGLEAYLAELESENEAYDALSQQRVSSRAASQKESGTAIRERIDERYAELTLLAQSFAIAQPSDKGNTFIPALNQLIAETTAAYNQRIAQGKKKKETKPETEPSDDGGSGTPEGI